MDNQMITTLVMSAMKALNEKFNIGNVPIESFTVEGLIDLPKIIVMIKHGTRSFEAIFRETAPKGEFSLIYLKENVLAAPTMPS